MASYQAKEQTKPPSDTSGSNIFQDWMASCIMQCTFGLLHTHNVTVVEYEEARINWALKHGQLVGSHTKEMPHMFRNAWESAIRGRKLVVKATGSFYEGISLPTVSPRKIKHKTKSVTSKHSVISATPKSTTLESVLPKSATPRPEEQGGVIMYTEELIKGEWVRTYHDHESYAVKMMELICSSNPFRTGVSAKSDSEVAKENGSGIDSNHGTDAISDDVTNDVGDDVTDDVAEEGTKPDIDMMLVDLDKKLCHVVEQSEEDLFAIMVPSGHPGFLYLVHPQTNQYISTDWFRSLDNVDDARSIAILCFCRMNLSKSLPKITSITNQGPAVTLEFDVSDPQLNFTDSMDVVRSLYCPQWPPEARRWDDRVYQWPDQKLVETIIHDGCHIVAVPHPLCKDARYEFRYSFSHAEVLLTRSFAMSPIVYSKLFTYMLTKMIIKFLIKKASPQIKSYYGKTTFYWYLESDDVRDDVSLWTHCAKVLWLLQKFFHERNVPNYCIPTNNMIRHVDVSDCRLIADAIQKVLDDPIGAILEIHRDVVVLGYELGDYNNGMTKVLQDLGFKTSPRPHFSILNSAFQGLHNLIVHHTKADVTDANLTDLHACTNSRAPATDSSAACTNCMRSARNTITTKDSLPPDVEIFKAFLQGTLGTALCIVQIEPKVVASRVMLNAFSAFQECSEVCIKCRQEVSMVDFMFWVMLHGVAGETTVKNRQNADSIPDAVSEGLATEHAESNIDSCTHATSSVPASSPMLQSTMIATRLADLSTNSVTGTNVTKCVPIPVLRKATDNTEEPVSERKNQTPCQ